MGAIEYNRKAHRHHSLIKPKNIGVAYFGRILEAFGITVIDFTVNLDECDEGGFQDR